MRRIWPGLRQFTWRYLRLCRRRRGRPTGSRLLSVTSVVPRTSTSWTRMVVTCVPSLSGISVTFDRSGRLTARISSSLPWSTGSTQLCESTWMARTCGRLLPGKRRRATRTTHPTAGTSFISRTSRCHGIFLCARLPVARLRRLRIRPISRKRARAGIPTGGRQYSSARRQAKKRRVTSGCSIPRQGPGATSPAPRASANFIRTGRMMELAWSTYVSRRAISMWRSAT